VLQQEEIDKPPAVYAERAPGVAADKIAGKPDERFTRRWTIDSLHARSPRPLSTSSQSVPDAGEISTWTLRPVRAKRRARAYAASCPSLSAKTTRRCTSDGGW